MTKPITRTLAVFESDMCSNSMILHEFDRMKRAPEYDTSLPGSYDKSMQEAIQELIESRWKFIRSQSHSTSIAYLLDPSKPVEAFKTFKKTTSSRETINKAVELAERLGLPHDVTPSKFRSLLTGFYDDKKSWNEETKAENSKYPPLDWWTTQDDMPVLQDFAAKVLSSPTSSAASERLWSTQGFIHSKARNKLRVRRVEKLSFVRTNGGDKSTRSEVIYQTPPVVESDDDMSSDEEDTSVFDFDSDDFALLLESIANFDGEYDDSADEGEDELADEANDEGGDNF